MSLQTFVSREVPADTAEIGQALFPRENMYRQIGDRFDDLFPDESIFAPLYKETGRGAISPLLLSLVTIFQMLEKLPDRLAAEQTVSRIDWKYALHLPLTYLGFHFTVLKDFRKRLLAHGQERLVFDQMLKTLVELGLIKRRGKMRTDSTHVLAVVERLSQLELICESIRSAQQAILKALPEWGEEALPAVFRDQYSQRQSEFGLSQSEIEKRLVKAGQDGFWLLNQVREAPQVVQELPEIEVLRQVLEQQYPKGPGGAASSRRPTGGSVVESPHEPEARYSVKRGKGWIGYKIQVTETCDGDLPHLIVDLEPTSAHQNDSPEVPQIQARLKNQQLLPGEQYVDQGYMSGKNLVTSKEQGIDLVGVPLNDTQGPQGFQQSDFQIDVAHQQAICPEGHVSRVWSHRQIKPGEPSAILVRFDARTCQTCPHFGICTTSPQGRSLTLHPYRAALLDRRSIAETPEYRVKLHLRAGVEATISELVRGHGLRQARYRGKQKLRLQAYFAALAINLKRLMRWWAQPIPSQELISTA